jgi:hypothetical protein
MQTGMAVNKSNKNFNMCKIVAGSGPGSASKSKVGYGSAPIRTILFVCIMFSVIFKFVKTLVNSLSMQLVETCYYRLDLLELDVSNVFPGPVWPLHGEISNLKRAKGCNVQCCGFGYASN